MQFAPPCCLCLLGCIVLLCRWIWAEPSRCLGIDAKKLCKMVVTLSLSFNLIITHRSTCLSFVWRVGKVIKIICVLAFPLDCCQDCWIWEAYSTCIAHTRVMLYPLCGVSLRVWCPMIVHRLICILFQIILSTCGACLEVVFEFGWIATTYFGSLMAILNLRPLGMPKWVWPSRNRWRMFHTTSKHAPQTYQTWKVFCTWPHEFATCKPKLAMVEICGFGDLLVDIDNGSMQWWWVSDYPCLKLGNECKHRGFGNWDDSLVIVLVQHNS